jgi:cysteine desulfurase
MTEAVYLDGFATLPLAPEAERAILDAWSLPGNATSQHSGGDRAAQIITEARTQIAALIGAAASEVYFTSGATEANNIALLGGAKATTSHQPGRRRIIVSAIEHKAVLEPAAALGRNGFDVVAAPVDVHGRLDLSVLAALIDEKTLLVSIMAVNNETGVIQPIAEAARLAHQVGALLHCDAAQAAGKIGLDVLELDADYLSLSAHKCYGPMGVGALYVSATAPRPAPLQFGGGQQGGLRPGTEPVGLIAGFGAAAAVCRAKLDADRSHGEGLAAMLLETLRSAGVGLVSITGDHPVVPGSAAIALSGIDADDLCLRLSRRVQISTGSACTSGQLRQSHVLEAMGFSEAQARHVLRIFCHRYLTRRDVLEAAGLIADAVGSSFPVATGASRQ